LSNLAAVVTYADLPGFNPQSGQYAYAPQGAIQAMALGGTVAQGTGLLESTTWDPVRLQPMQMQASSPKAATRTADGDTEDRHEGGEYDTRDKHPVAAVLRNNDYDE
jgi:hypothetical protein